MQSVSSGSWTRVAVSISYDDNHYTTGTWHIKRISDIQKEYKKNEEIETLDQQK